MDPRAGLRTSGGVNDSSSRSGRFLGRVVGFALSTFLLLADPAIVFGWGADAHRMINEEAVATLPEPLRAFFAAHRRELSDCAVEPDSVFRARYGRKEAVRHFIDLDLYGQPPFSELPRSYRAAVQRFGRDRVVERRVGTRVVGVPHLGHPGSLTIGVLPAGGRAR